MGKRAMGLSGKRKARLPKPPQGPSRAGGAPLASKVGHAVASGRTK